RRARGLGPGSTCPARLVGTGSWSRLPHTPRRPDASLAVPWIFGRGLRTAMGIVAERVRPTVARVDLGVLKSNYRAIREHLKRERPTGTPGVIAVVKANAYGHGAAQVGRALED